MAGCEDDYPALATHSSVWQGCDEEKWKVLFLQKEDFSRRRGGLDKFDFEPIVVQVRNGMEVGGAGDRGCRSLEERCASCDSFQDIYGSKQKNYPSP